MAGAPLSLSAMSLALLIGAVIYFMLTVYPTRKALRPSSAF